MTRSTATPVHFRPTRWRSGYHPEQVDEFVETVEDALRSPTPLLSSSEVARQRFTSVLLKPGYNMDDVDDYLAEAEQRLSAREHLA